jgi:hypothetical protein
MTTVSITSEEARAKFKGKKILVVGDAISRGIYKDLACLLSGQNRLLTINELRFNRHKKHLNVMFNETIDLFNIDRSNGVNNLEQRTLTSVEDDYYVRYYFSSCVWNTRMEHLLSSIDQYDFIFMQSMIWDLSRYNDCDGRYYLANLESCLSKFKKMNKQIVWIIVPPSNSDNTHSLNNLISKLHPSVIEILNRNDCQSINLSEKIIDDTNIRCMDGIHFTPEGHRFITYHLIKSMADLSISDNRTNLNIQSSSIINLLGSENSSRCENTISLKRKVKKIKNLGNFFT